MSVVRTLGVFVMTPELKVGDQVRLKPGRRYPGLLPGDTGTIVTVLPPSSSEKQTLYHVRMNRTTAGMYGTFNADELEHLR
jgi:hypothetical protein